MQHPEAVSPSLLRCREISYTSVRALDGDFCVAIREFLESDFVEEELADTDQAGDNGVSVK